MSRTLFPGWRPDAAGRERLQALVARMVAARPADAPALRLRRADQWHVTLCFIGRDQGQIVGSLTCRGSGAFLQALGFASLTPTYVLRAFTPRRFNASRIGWGEQSEPQHRHHPTPARPCEAQGHRAAVRGLRR